MSRGSGVRGNFVRVLRLDTMRKERGRSERIPIRTKFHRNGVEHNVCTRVSAGSLRHLSKVRSPLTINRRSLQIYFQKALLVIVRELGISRCTRISLHTDKQTVCTFARAMYDAKNDSANAMGRYEPRVKNLELPSIVDLPASAVKEGLTKNNIGIR